MLYSPLFGLEYAKIFLVFIHGCLLVSNIVLKLCFQVANKLLIVSESLDLIESGQKKSTNNIENKLLQRKPKKC